MPVNAPPVQVLDSTVATPVDQYSSNSSVLTSSTPNLMSQPVSKFVNMNDLESTIIVVVETRLSQNQRQKQRCHSQRLTRGAARGRNLRTTNGQPICNTCQRVGHVSHYCDFDGQSSVAYLKIDISQKCGEPKLHNKLLIVRILSHLDFSPSSLVRITKPLSKVTVNNI